MGPVCACITCLCMTAGNAHPCACELRDNLQRDRITVGDCDTLDQTHKPTPIRQSPSYFAQSAMAAHKDRSAAVRGAAPRRWRRPCGAAAPRTSWPGARSPSPAARAAARCRSCRGRSGRRSPCDAAPSNCLSAACERERAQYSRRRRSELGFVAGAEGRTESISPEWCEGKDDT